MTLRVGVVVPAAGSGRRMGGVSKPFLELDGQPVLRRALRPFLEDPRVEMVVVALGPDVLRDPPAWLRDADARVRLTEGGASRAQSVRRALAALPPGLDVIAVHDAARPLVERAVVSRCIDLAAAGQGAVAGCPAVDTIKRVGPAGDILGTPERSELWHAQTPQAFPAEALRSAYEDAAAEGTDDAALVEGRGLRIVMVDAGAGNLKITRPDDLALAHAVLTARSGRQRPSR